MTQNCKLLVIIVIDANVWYMLLQGYWELPARPKVNIYVGPPAVSIDKIARRETYILRVLNMINKVYYDIRVKNKDSSEDYLIMMNVHEDLADTYIARESMNTLYEGMIVYKQRSR